ncbi:hypothetical protein FAI41_01450 [Acetobacteraceae bacterium]|nr:hypothetical protein FAI41_01450 [Acetobacteraceae bacterium]
MLPQKDPLSSQREAPSPSVKKDFPHQKSFWSLIIILFLSGFMLFSQYYLKNLSTETALPQRSENISNTNVSPIDKSISLPILSQDEIEAALASPKTASNIKEALLAASHNKRLRLVKMPLQTEINAPLPIEITTAGMTQNLILSPERQSVILPIDRTGVVNIKLTEMQKSPRTVIAFDSFGPFPLPFQPVKNAQITLLIVSQ